MYVVMNELHVPKVAKEHLKQRFSKSSDSMKQVPGCLEFMYLDNENEDGKIVVFTKWESKEFYEAWLKSDAFKKAHEDSGNGSQGPASQNEVFAYNVVYHT